MDKMKTFVYNDIEWTYFPEFVLQDTRHRKEYLFLYQNEITQERIMHHAYVKDFIMDKHPDNIKNDSAWKIIGFQPITEKEKHEFYWKKPTDDTKFENRGYELLIDDGVKTSVMYAYHNNKFDINTKKFKILEYREANYSEKMPIEEGVYRVVIYNKYMHTRKTVPVYMIDNKFIFENGLVVGDSIELVSECLTTWVPTQHATMHNILMAVLGSHINFTKNTSIIDNQLDLLYGINNYDNIAVYKNNSRCKLGLQCVTK